MQLKWHLLLAASLIALGLLVWAQILNGNISFNAGIPSSAIKIHIAVDIVGVGALVGLVALLVGVGLMLAAIARAFLPPR